jgi:hypothetical protein
MKKEIKADNKRWKDLPCSWMDRINIMEMAILWKATFRFNVISIKISMTFIMELEKCNITVRFLVSLGWVDSPEASIKTRAP